MQTAPHTLPLVPADVEPVSRRDYTLILIALAMGGFAVGTSEFASMGLLPNIAATFAISAPQVGHLISAYAIGVVVGAPVLAVIGARFPRRTLLIALMALYAVGNLASALAPTYHSALVFRFIAGLPHGAYFGVAALVAASISRPDQRATSVGRVMLGLSLAILVGNPLATWAGGYVSWRWAFAVVAAIAVLTMVLVTLLLPRDTEAKTEQPLKELRDFNHPQVWFALLLGAVGFAGMFAVFTYAAPTLTDVTGLSSKWLPFAMSCFGIGAIIGTLGGGWLFDRFQFAAVKWMLLWAVVVLLLFPLAAHRPWSLFLCIVAVGTMGGLGPILQTRLMDVAANAQTLAAASHHAAFNVANAIGPWLGGVAITAGFGWTSTGYVGAALAVVALGIYALARRQELGSG